MSTKKGGTARPDKYSKKRGGVVAQSVRLTVAEARLIRKASALQHISAHQWMKQLLVAVAKLEVEKAAAKKTETTTQTESES